MNIANIMTRDPKFLPPTATVAMAAKLMRDLDSGVIPIVDADKGLLGVVTDRDIVVRAIAEGHGLDTKVTECMTTQPETVTRDTTVEQAATIMSHRQIRRLPVVEYGRLIGMVSLSDLAKSAAPEEDKAEVLEDVSMDSQKMGAEMRSL